MHWAFGLALVPFVRVSRRGRGGGRLLGGGSSFGGLSIGGGTSSSGGSGGSRGGGRGRRWLGSFELFVGGDFAGISSYPDDGFLMVS